VRTTCPVRTNQLSFEYEARVLCVQTTCSACADHMFCVCAKRVSCVCEPRALLVKITCPMRAKHVSCVCASRVLCLRNTRPVIFHPPGLVREPDGSDWHVPGVRQRRSALSAHGSTEKSGHHSVRLRRERDHCRSVENGNFEIDRSQSNHAVSGLFHTHFEYARFILVLYRV